MQIDMHYYGCYVLARLAGIKEKTANVIASASQYVDDSYFKDESFGFSDGSYLKTIITSHNVFTPEFKENLDRINDKKKQREVWVPFHFLPGNKGDTFLEKIICRQNSQIAQTMTDNILEKNNLTYYNFLVGICAHVYADTFAHFGFSGVGSELNKVKGDSISFENLHGGEIEQKVKDIAGEYYDLIEDFIPSIMSNIGESSSSFLGHGGVASYPDKPYLEWNFEYEDGRISERDNKESFLEGAKNLFNYFKKYKELNPKYADLNTEINSFGEIKKEIKNIISFEGAEEQRIEKWKEFVRNDDKYFNNEEKIPTYKGDEWWESRKELKDKESVNLNEYPLYQFYRAAAHYRTYVLRELLPDHGIFVI